MAHGAHHHDSHPDLDEDPDPSGGPTWFWSIAGSLMCIATIFAVATIYFWSESAEVDAKIINQPHQEVQALRAAQEATLAQYGRYTVALADGSEEERIRIPITRAFELLLAEGIKAPPAPAAVPAPVSAAKPAPGPAVKPVATPAQAPAHGTKP